jgi:hypothetical protein
MALQVSIQWVSGGASEVLACESVEWTDHVMQLKHVTSSTKGNVTSQLPEPRNLGINLAQVRSWAWWDTP